MNNDMPIIEYDKTLEYIIAKTGFTSDIVEKVLDAESEYMIELGIIAFEE